MTQSRLSHCLLLNTHKEALGELSLIKIANEFCRKNEARLNIFWKFSQEEIPQHLVVKMSVATQTFEHISLFFTFFDFFFDNVQQLTFMNF